MLYLFWILSAATKSGIFSWLRTAVRVLIMTSLDGFAEGVSFCYGFLCVCWFIPITHVQSFPVGRTSIANTWFTRSNIILQHLLLRKYEETVGLIFSSYITFDENVRTLKIMTSNTEWEDKFFSTAKSIKNILCLMTYLTRWSEVVQNKKLSLRKSV